MRHAFSLVELSIVLVILGLLTGGILAGQSLIRASELRTLSTDAQRYAAAVNTFRDKYMALPGDMPNATSFWNKLSACSSQPGTLAAPGTCNGNGDGLATPYGSAGDSSEFFQFWRQLALAGLIEGSYTGLNDANYALCVVGSNCPRLRMGNGSALPIYYYGDGTDGWWSARQGGTGNWIGMGTPGSGISYPFNSIITPEEMWNLDTKMDDGKPASGRVMPMGCTAYSSTCAVDSAGSAPTVNCNAFVAASPVYNLRLAANACAPTFKL